MTERYIILSNNGANFSKRFRVISEGYKPVLDKSQTLQRTVGGGIDVCYGHVYELHEYQIRVATEESDVQYGTRTDLELFYRLNAVSGSASGVLTLTDHYGNTHSVLMVGQHIPRNLSCVIDGLYAYWIVPVQIQFIPE